MTDHSSSYRLLALDLDGTLLDSKRAIRDDSIAAIKKVQERGIEVILVTGRHHTAVRPYHWQLGLSTPAICCNGTYVYDFATQRPLISDPLDKDTARALVSWAERHDIHMLLYADDAIIYEAVNENLQSFNAWVATVPAAVQPLVRPVNGSFANDIDQVKNVWKVLVTAENGPKMMECLKEIETSLPVDCEWSWENRVDINPRGNSKGKRLEELATQKGIAASEVIAFGDQMNDITMLAYAGLGIAMDNGKEEAKSQAKYVTAGNDEGGIAAALERFVL